LRSVVWLIVTVDLKKKNYVIVSSETTAVSQRYTTVTLGLGRWICNLGFFSSFWMDPCHPLLLYEILLHHIFLVIE